MKGGWRESRSSRERNGDRGSGGGEGRGRRREVLETQTDRETGRRRKDRGRIESKEGRRDDKEGMRKEKRQKRTYRDSQGDSALEGAGSSPVPGAVRHKQFKHFYVSSRVSKGGGKPSLPVPQDHLTRQNASYSHPVS